MASSDVRRIFLSAVTREFRRSRELLRNDLMGPDLPYLITEQTDFAVGGGSLLEKLDRYISDCSAVVHLIGKATGVAAGPDETAHFLESRPNFLQHHKSLRQALKDFNSLSYTQWEAYMALHYRVPLFIFLPTENFDERPPGFTITEEEGASQQQHLDLLLKAGLDRGEFSSSDRLCTHALRSLSRLLIRSSEAEDNHGSKDLESFALLREADENTEPSERATLAPFQVDLELPLHLVAGQSFTPIFNITEPGRTSVEQVDLDFQISSFNATAQCDHLAKGASVSLIPEVGLDLQKGGTPQMQVIVGCKRSCLQERFIWKGVANVISAERLAGARSVTQRSKTAVKKLKLELFEETLTPRQGELEIALQPIPAGGERFEMGSKKTDRGHQPDELIHPVRFTNSWWMSRHPISQRQFMAIMGKNPAKFNQQSDELPVECVTWAEAVEFCELLTQMESGLDRLPLGFQYRLPTEAEWEFSCRGGEETAITAINVTNNNPDTKNRAISHPICTFPLDGNRGANRFGLCDMTGNVYQWCLDGYGPYPSAVQVNPCLGNDLPEKVIRGGSWHDAAPFRRVTARMKVPPETRSSRIGFRIILARV